MKFGHLAFATLFVSSLATAVPVDIDLRGSLKSFLSYQKLKQQGITSSSNLPGSEQRLRLQTSISKDWFLLEAAHEFSLYYQAKLDPRIPIPDFTPLSAWNTSSKIYDNGNVSLTKRLDRLFVQISSGDIELRVGKQIIDEGVGRIFTAVSQVPRYPFAFLDTEYPKTEDAVSLLWKGSLTLETRYLPKVRGQQSDNFHVRAKGSKQGYDVALTAGKSDDKAYGGLEAAGNLGDSLLRAELVGYEWNGKKTVQAMVGWDEVISPSFSFQLEAFHNGFGDVEGYVVGPLRHRSVPYRGRWYAGAVLNYEISPRWKSAFSTVANVSDPSFLMNVTFTCSLMNNLDLIVGQYLGVGSRTDSEFGKSLRIPHPTETLAFGLPDITYAELKYYF